MKVMAQMSMVMNLDKCIGCHTCSVTCKQVWHPMHLSRFMTMPIWARMRISTPPRPGACE
jgi:nitrate reductase beta subunit